MEVKAFCSGGPPGIVGGYVFVSRPGSYVLIRSCSGGSSVSGRILDVHLSRGGRPIAGGLTGGLLGGVLLGPIGALAGGTIGALQGGYTAEIRLETSADANSTVITLAKLNGDRVRALGDVISHAESNGHGSPSSLPEGFDVNAFSSDQLLEIVREAQAPQVDGTRRCPWCAEEIQSAAVVCRFCGRDVEQDAANHVVANDDAQAKPAEQPPQSAHPSGEAAPCSTGSLKVPELLLRVRGAARYDNIVSTFMYSRKQTATIRISGVSDEVLLRNLTNACARWGGDEVSASKSPRSMVRLSKRMRNEDV